MNKNLLFLEIIPCNLFYQSWDKFNTKHDKTTNQNTLMPLSFNLNWILQTFLSKKQRPSYKRSTHLKLTYQLSFKTHLKSNKNGTNTTWPKQLTQNIDRTFTDYCVLHRECDCSRCVSRKSLIIYCMIKYRR